MVGRCFFFRVGKWIPQRKCESYFRLLLPQYIYIHISWFIKGNMLSFTFYFMVPEWLSEFQKTNQFSWTGKDLWKAIQLEVFLSSAHLRLSEANAVVQKSESQLGGGVMFFKFSPIPFWLIFFQMGWNHQLVKFNKFHCKISRKIGIAEQYKHQFSLTIWFDTHDASMYGIFTYIYICQKINQM